MEGGFPKRLFFIKYRYLLDLSLFSAFLEARKPQTIDDSYNDGYQNRNKDHI